MDELSGRLVANLGIDRAAAEKSVGNMPDFLAKEDSPDKAQSFVTRLSTAANAMSRMVGAGMRMGARPGTGEVQSVTQQFTTYEREKVDEDGVGEMVAGISGLVQFV